MNTNLSQKKSKELSKFAPYLQGNSSKFLQKFSHLDLKKNKLSTKKSKEKVDADIPLLADELQKEKDQESEVLQLGMSHQQVYNDQEIHHIQHHNKDPSSQPVVASKSANSNRSEKLDRGVVMKKTPKKEIEEECKNPPHHLKPLAESTKTDDFDYLFLVHKDYLQLFGKKYLKKLTSKHNLKN